MKTFTQQTMPLEVRLARIRAWEQAYAVNDTAEKVWINLSCDFVPAAPHVGRVNNVRAESVKLKAHVKQVYWSFLPAPVKLVRILTGKR